MKKRCSTKHKRMGKRNRKTVKKSRKLKGGKALGKGTYGVVMGKPRMPCNNEDFVKDRIESKDEASKLFFNESRDAPVIVQTLELLNKSFTKKELKDLNNYFIMPEQLCKINHKEMSKNTKVYNDAWRDGVDVSKYTIQAVSELGKNDLSDELDKATTRGDLLSFMVNMRTIIEGIAKIHEKDIMHGDLKLGNAMVDLKGVFKIIDNDELKDIKNFTFDESFFYNNHSYAIWPTLINMLLEQYNTSKYATEEEYVKTTMAIPFNSSSRANFKTTYSETLSKITRSDFTRTFLNEKDPKNYIAMVDKLFDILRASYGDDTRKHMNVMYKFIDRYSFGFMLLTILKRWFEVEGAKDDEPIIADLLELIENCCFIENGLKITTDEIKTQYFAFADSL